MKNLKDKTTVTVKPMAYYKMLVHVLRFGSKTRDRRQYKEVMGMLIGHLEGEEAIKNVIIEDAVPVSHGGSIEVQFAPGDYISFAAIDEQFAEKNWFTVGWYHSHPNLKIFFSATDIKNQMGWQTPNPSAIGIVFDHTYLEKEGDMGFRTFRLDDPNKPGTNYHEVNTIVEPPDNLNYYVKIMELINSIHTREPPILELNETPDLFGDISIPYPNELMAERPELQLEELLTAFQSGISSFLVSSIEPLMSYLNTWSQNVIEKVIQNNLQMRGSLVSLKEILSEKIANLQNAFKFSLTSKLNDLDVYIYDRFEGFDKDRERMRSSIEQMKEELIGQVNLIFKEKVKASVEQNLSSINDGTAKIADMTEKTSSNVQNVQQQQNSLGSFSEALNSVKSSSQDKLKQAQEKIGNVLTEKIDLLKNSLSELNKQANELSSTLGTAITSFESSQKPIQDLKNKSKELNDKLEGLESEKQTLEQKVKLLESENPELLDKITQVDSIEAEKQEFTKQIKELQSKNESLQKQLKEIEKEKEELQKKQSSTGAEKEELQTQLKELLSEKESLQEQLQKSDVDRQEFLEKINALETTDKKGKKKEKPKKEEKEKKEEKSKKKDKGKKKKEKEGGSK